jgi:hypothetical protein
MQFKKPVALGLLLAMGLIVNIPAHAEAIPVKIVKDGTKFQLYRGGEPYEVKGAGLEFSDVGVFASHGGNSIRTWRTDNGQATGLEVLDEALKHGVSVTMCIEIGRERHGFDYDDEAAVAAQLEYARGEVMKYKDHPALLTWMIGNEPNLFFKNPKVFDAINDISKMIHEVDKNHPTTTALAGFNAGLANLIEERASDLDFVSIQMYGDIVNLPRYLKEIGWEKPIFVTEWGSIGHWEVAKTRWGAPIEPTSTEKAEHYMKSYQVAIASNPDQIMGSYVFLWGQKQERTPTWYGMFLPTAEETETIDVMHNLWNGKWPDNRAPRIESMKLDGKKASKSIELTAGKRYKAKVKSTDPDGDTLSYRWEIMEESKARQEGGDKEVVPYIIDGDFKTSGDGGINMTAPAKPGAYRLFVYVLDGAGNAGHANIPFLVN